MMHEESHHKAVCQGTVVELQATLVEECEHSLINVFLFTDITDSKPLRAVGTT